MADTTQRPSVDVVVPFAGTDDALADVIARLARLRARPGDTVVIADNRRSPAAAPAAEPVEIVAAGERPGSYFARNRGATLGTNPWIVFLDADVEPPGDLLDRYFATTPDERCAVLGGGIVDEPAGAGAPRAVRHAHEQGLMSQEVTLARAAFAYVQTANCAVRRSAFEAVGGFRDEIRSGGDADLCFRLRDAGWTIERREEARVVHRSRTSVAALLRQRARVGAGSRWLEERYPGFAPRRPLTRALAWNARRIARGDPPLEALADAAFVVGWRLPNRARPAARRRRR